MFKTERLVLRAYTTADLQTILRIANNPLVQRTLISEHVVPRSERFAVKLEEIANQALLYVVLEAVDRGGEVIGAASLAVDSVKNRDVNLGIGLLPDVWNKGYGTEATRFLVDYAFRDLGVHRVSLNVLVLMGYNMFCSGFVEEGRRRKANWLDGKWHDSVYMGILEEDWLKPSEN